MNRNRQIQIYPTDDDKSKIEMTLTNDSIWLTLKQRKLKT